MKEIELGTVVGTFSFRGEVRVHLHNPASTLLAEGKPVVLVSPTGERRGAVLATRPGAGGRVIGRIDGIADEDAARALRGWRIILSTDALPALQADEYYVWQLEGCVVRVGEAGIGRIEAIHEAGPHEVLEIRSDDGEAHFVPLRKEFVRAVHLEQRVVELIPNALEEDG